MCENINVNDWEYIITERYKGVYSPEEIELNKKLYKECYDEIINLEAVEALLKQGADPLGPTEGVGRGLLEHIYGDIILDAQDYGDTFDLPGLTELFLKYGMDVDNPRIPYDDGNSINPLWELGLVSNENAIATLKLLLDKGLSVESFGEFWSTSMGDLIDFECGDPVNDKYWNNACVCSLKATMLGASYDHILNEYEHLRKFIGYSYNDYDIHNFRNWNDYIYEFDTSHCTRHSGYAELYKSIVTIYEHKSNKAIWKIGVYLDEDEL